MIDLTAVYRTTNSSMTVALSDLPVDEARSIAKEYVLKGFDVTVEFIGADDQVEVVHTYREGVWSSFDYTGYQRDHVCTYQETPDGYGCVTCLYT